jgi:hypothetical protein
MYRIVWKSKVSEISGKGQYNLSEKEAKEQVEGLTKDFPLANYWYECERPPPLNLKGHRCSYGDLTFIETKSPEASPV